MKGGSETISDGRYSRFEWSRGGFLPNAFALNMSMQRHPNTHTETHKHWHLRLLTHEILGSTVKQLVWGKATLEILGGLPVPACQTWGRRSVPVGFVFSVSFVYFIFFARVKLCCFTKQILTESMFLGGRSGVVGVHPNDECTWWDVGRFCISEQKKIK